MPHMCPITLEDIVEPICVTTQVEGNDPHPQLYEAEAILEHIRLRGLQDPINRQPIIAMDIAAQIRLDEGFSNGAHYIDKIANLMKPAVNQSNNNASSSQVAGLIPQPAMTSRENFPLTAIRTPRTEMHGKINVLLLGDASRFRIADILEGPMSQRTIGIDFFIVNSATNKFAVFDTAGQCRSKRLLKIYAKNAHIILYFGTNELHLMRLLTQFEIYGTRRTRFTFVQNNNDSVTMEPFNPAVEMTTREIPTVPTLQVRDLMLNMLDCIEHTVALQHADEAAQRQTAAASNSNCSLF